MGRCGESSTGRAAPTAFRIMSRRCGVMTEAGFHASPEGAVGLFGIADPDGSYGGGDSAMGEGAFAAGAAAIERALVEERVDIAVHSFKDLPVADTPGLVVAAVPPRGPVEDVLCARAGSTLGSPTAPRARTAVRRTRASRSSSRPESAQTAAGERSSPSR